MRTTIRIDDQLYRRAKAHAARTGQTVSTLIEDAVRASLRPAPPERVRPERLPVFGGSGVLPGVDLTSNAGLLDAMDER